MNRVGPDVLNRHARLRLSRRDVLRGTGLAAIGGGVLHRSLGSASANTSLANVALPPEVGQTYIQLYIAETGHTVQGSMLDYWRANGAASVFGNPISEPFAAANGYYSQAFERIVLQYQPDYFYTHDPIMRPFPIGQVVLDALQQEAPRELFERPSFDRQQLREAAQPRFGGDAEVIAALNEGGLYVEQTGHTVSGEILSWYQFHEGGFYLGAPLTEPYRDREQTFQLFVGGLVVVRDDGVALAPLAAQLAEALGIDTTPVDRNGLPLYDELTFWTVPNPNPLADPSTPGRKWIEISIPQQRLWAYQGTTALATTLVSTGLPPNQTQRGSFHVRLRYLAQDMAGFTDQSGAVLGFGDAPPGTIPYEVTDVPHVLYFSTAAEAIHGAYWHNNFGQKMSHGCVNLPLDMAAWLYGWSPLGTEVWIHE
jgi:hypothetical protein